MIIFEILPYVILLLLTLFIPKVSKKYMMVLFFIYFVFCGFRYGVGWDYYNYLETLESVRGIENTEFIIRQIEWFCYNNHLKQFFFVATSFFTILFFFLMIAKESVNPGVSVFVYLTLSMFFFHSMTTVRFTMAVAIGFFACYYGYKKQYVPYIALLLVSILTHKAALFGVLTIPFVLTKAKFNFSINLIIFLVCVVVGTVLGTFSVVKSVFDSLLRNEFLFDFISDAEVYLNDRGGENFSRTPYIFAFINLINLFSARKLASTVSDDRLWHYITMFNIGCSIVFLFSFHAVLASRLSQFFMTFILLIVPYYKKYSVQQFILYALFLFGFFYQLTIHASNPDFIGRINCWLPYRMNFIL